MKSNEIVMLTPRELRTRAASKALYPFALLEIGDSFTFPIERIAKVSSARSIFVRSRPSAAKKQFIVKTRDENTGVAIRTH